MRASIIRKVTRLQDPIHGGNASCNLDFSVNMNPLGPPADLLDSMQEKVGSFRLYHSSEKLKRALSEVLGLPSSLFVFGEGATRIIYDLATAFPCTSKFYIMNPTFSEYERAVIRLGRPAYLLGPNGGFDLNLNAAEERCRSGDVVFLCNPNNPTGKHIRAGKLMEFVSTLERRGCYVCIDESYAWTTSGDGIQNEVPSHDFLIVVRSVGKLLSLPSLRAGYAVCPDKIARRTEIVQSPWIVNPLLEVALLFSVQNRKFLDESREYIQAERERVRTRLMANGVRAERSHTNFYLIDAEQFDLTAKELSLQLLEKGISVRDCSSIRFMGNNWIRVGVKKRKEDDEFVSALGEIG
jgi:threonine-phosphate decarboxylase